MPDKQSSQDPIVERLGSWLRTFMLFAWRIRFGWALVVIMATALAASGVVLLVFVPKMPPRVGRIAVYLLVGAWCCVGILLAMMRRQLRGHARDPSQLTALGRIGRIALTVIATAGFLLPFAWIAWRVVR